MISTRDRVGRDVSLRKAIELAGKLQARAKTTGATRVDRVRYNSMGGVIVRGELTRGSPSDWSGMKNESPQTELRNVLDALNDRKFFGSVELSMVFVSGEFVACEVSEDIQTFKLDVDEPLRDVVELCSR